MMGGIVGSVVGAAGAALGAYVSIRNTRGPRERAFVIKANVTCWLAALAFVVVMFMAPVPYRFWLIPVYVIGLLSNVRLWNRKQFELREEESRRGE